MEATIHVTTEATAVWYNVKREHNLFQFENRNSEVR